MGKLTYFGAGLQKSIYPKMKIQGVLISSATEGKTERSILYRLKMLEKIQYQYMILDSGGYQLIAAEQKGNLKKSKIMDWLTPKHVMTSAAKFNPDIVMALDYPILNISDPQKQVREFEKKIITNLRWSRECIELKDSYCPQAQLFLPVQAYNTKQMDFFFTKLASTKFDGVSLPARNSSPPQIIQQLLFLHNIGIRKIHLLGTSTFTSIIVSAFMAKHYFDWVSLDSTSWRQRAQYGLYLHPGNLSTIKIKPNRTYPSIKCSCPWCKYQNLYDLTNLPVTDCTFFVANHNYFVIENICRQAFDHSDSINKLEKFSKLRIANMPREKITNLFEALHLFEILAGEQEGYKLLSKLFKKKQNKL